MVLISILNPWQKGLLTPLLRITFAKFNTIDFIFSDNYHISLNHLDCLKVKQLYNQARCVKIL